jgi:predicted acylesterase/phospholipase RssA
VLIVADAEADPAPGATEALLDAQDTVVAPRRALVLIHPDGRRRPQGTRRWLAPRRVRQHYHVRWDRDHDVRRVARFLSDRAVGVVLSGGGARGFAHIGLLRALGEHGVPIDVIGGTSMGAILGAQFAMERDWETVLRSSRDTFVTPKPFRKYTLPLFSLLRHGVFDGSAGVIFGDTEMEDLWTPCFCVATDLSSAESVVFRRGPVTEATLASSALPGVVTPRVRDGHLLVDGGVLANTPTAAMQRDCSVLIVSDVTEGKAADVEFDAFPSPWRALWQRLSPFHEKPVVPGLMNILTRTAVLGSVARDALARDAADLYLRMPVEPYGILEMDRIDEIVEAGYAYSRDVLEAGRASEADAPWYARVMAKAVEA